MKLHRVDHIYSGKRYLKTVYLYQPHRNISEHLTANHKHADFAPKIAVGNVLTLLTPATSGLPFRGSLVVWNFQSFFTSRCFSRLVEISQGSRVITFYMLLVSYSMS